MFKKGLISVILVLTVLTSFIVCNAESQRIATADINNETRVLSIEGSGWAIPYTKVALQIVNPKMDAVAVADPNETFIHIDQVKTGADGAFTYSYTLPASASSGKYTLRLFGYGDADIMVKSFEFTNLTNRATAVTNMQGATKEGVKGVLDTYIVDLDIDAADKYEKFNDAEQMYVAGELHSNMSDSYDSIMPVINEGIKKVELLNTIQTDTRTNAKKVLDDNLTLLGITDTDALSIYGNATYTEHVIVSLTNAVKNTEDKIITPDMLPQIFIDVCDAVKESVDEANKNNNKNPGKPDKNKDRDSGFAFGGGSMVANDPPIPANSQEKFADMGGYEWAKNAVYKLTEKGIINGKSDQSFCPADRITREEFAKLVYVAFNIDPADGNVEFEDADKDSWYYDYVAALAQKGIVNGVSDTRFGVGTPISRQDMATMLYRTVEKEKYDIPVVKDEATIMDMDNASEYAKDAIIMLNRCNAINGNEQQMFNPQNYTTRAEAAQMLYNMLYVLNIL